MFVIICVIYRPIEQLLSRTIADRRARGIETPSDARADHRSRAPSRWSFLAVALPLHDDARARRVRLGHALLDLRRRRSSPTRRATSRAAGSPATSTSRSTAAWSSWSRRRGIAFALAAAVGISHGQSAIALGIAAAPFVSLVVVPAAFASRAQRSGPPASFADAALEGPAAEGIEEAVERSLDPPRQRLRDLGVRDPARRADTAERRGADGRRDDPGGSSPDRARLRPAADHARAAAALPGDPDLAAAAPRGLEVTAGRAAFGRAIRITVLAIVGFALGGRARPAGRRPVRAAPRVPLRLPLRPLSGSR